MDFCTGAGKRELKEFERILSQAPYSIQAIIKAQGITFPVKRWT